MISPPVPSQDATPDPHAGEPQAGAPDALEAQFAADVFTDSDTFRRSFEQSPFSIQILSPDGRTLEVNRAWEQLWGIKLEQLLDYNMLEDEQLVARGIMPYIRRGFAGEAAAIPPILYDPESTIHTGRRRWVRGFIYPLKDNAGQVQQVVLVHEDVTQRMRSDEALHKSKEQLAAILNALSDSITVQDSTGSLVYANDAAARLLGFSSPASLVAAPLAEIASRFEAFDEEGQPVPTEKLPGRRVLAGESENQTVLRFRVVASGEERWAIVRAVPVFDAVGTVRFTINIFSDITERRQQEGERQALLDRVESERALLQAVLQQLPVGVLIAEAPSGKVILGNEQFSRVWRQPLDAFESYVQFREGKGFHSDGRPFAGHEWPLQRALSKGEQVTNEEFAILRGDGSCGSVQSSAGPVRDAAGKIVAAVVAITDVTERNAAEEKIRFQARLLETVGQSVVATDFEGIITYWNQAAQAMFGWSSEEALGRHVMDVLPTETSMPVAEQIMQMLQTGHVWRGEIEMRHKDGHPVPLLSVVSPIFDEHGAVVGMIGTSSDLSERKRAEEGQRLLAEAGAVLSSSLDYTTTLESVARLAVPTLADWCSVDIMSEDGNLERLAVTHRDPEKAQWGFELSRRYPPDPNSPVGVHKVLRSGKSEMIREITDDLIVSLVKDPELLEIIRELGFRSSMIVPLCARGRTLGAISFISTEPGRLYDQTDLQLAEELARRAGLAVDNARLYQEAQSARETAEIVNRTKDEFLATLSHELRTPLTAMLGWTDLLRTGMLPPDDQKRALEVISRNSRAQAQLIEDLLDVSRIITGKLRLNVKPINLSAIIEAAVDAVRPAAEAKNLDFRINLETPELRVAGDEARLQQVVWNLLSNAVKFTPVGGWVEVNLCRINGHTQGHAQIEVRDSGKGIAPEFIPFVFDRFRQADSSSTRNYGGLGLGLSIVRHLVEMHGGGAFVQSEGEDQGATFIVKLPLLTGDVKPETDVELHEPGEMAHDDDADVVPVRSGAQLRGLKVLVVEDDPDAREFVDLVLRREGARTQTAESAEQAMKVVRQWRPDVLISDIAMPGTDGYELIAQVRALPAREGGAVPAISLTAFARKEDRIRSLEAGYNAHLSKPVKPEQIVSAIMLLTGRDKTHETSI